MEKIGLNKRAYVTGGARGIGFGIVQELLKDGWFVAFTGRTRESVNQALRILSKENPQQVMAFATDVCDFEKTKLDINDLIAEWGGVDLLVANAAIAHFATLDKLETDQINAMIDINLKGTVFSVKAILPQLKISKGCIVLMGSLSVVHPFAEGSIYAATKAAVASLGQSLFLELREFGIKVTTILPGYTNTSFNEKMFSENNDWKLQPEDIGRVIVDILKYPAHVLPSRIELRPLVSNAKYFVYG